MAAMRGRARANLELRDAVFLVVAMDECSHCGEITPVVAFASADVWNREWGDESEPGEEPIAAILSSLSGLPESLLAEARQFNEGYGPVGAHGTLLNRCMSCRGPSAEEDLYREPGSAFHPTECELDVTWLRRLAGVAPLGVRGELSVGPLDALLAAGRDQVEVYALPGSLAGGRREEA